MRGDPITVVQAVFASTAITVVFIAVGALVVRRARDPKTKPRDALERLMLPRLARPSLRERVGFWLMLAVAAAAPWLTFLLQDPGA